MKKLLQINTVGNWGSTGRIAEDIGKTAQKKGWQTYIACARNIRESSSKIIRIGSSIEIFFNVIWNRIFDCDSPISKISTKKLISQIKELSPDIIHLHNTHGYYIHNHTLLNFLAEYNRPIVWTIHDCWIMTGHCAYFSYEGCNKWQTLCKNCPQKHKYPASFLLDNSTKNHIQKIKDINNIKNLTLVSISNWIKGLIEESNLKNIQIKTIRNGIDINTFKPTNLPVREKYAIPAKKIILFVASVWSMEKGFFHIPPIAEKLKGDFVCVVVGVNKKQKEYLSKHNIIGISRTENVSELAGLYSEAFLLINPTLQEGLSMVNMESIACGTPTITYDSGGTKETIINEYVGSVIPQNDMDALLESVEKFSHVDPKFTQNICREVAKKYFDKENIWEEYISLYEELLSKK